MMNLKPRQLSYSEFLLALGLKIALAVLYGYIFLHYYNGDDTWYIHNRSLEKTTELLSDPLKFFTDQYTPVFSIQHNDTWPARFGYYLKEFEFALVVKTLSIFNLVTGGNYYVNAVLFNAIFFFGHYWLFLLLKDIFPDARRRIYIGVFLFLPSVFWLSGIRADGLLFFFFSLFLWQLHKRRNVPLTAISFFCMLSLRPQFATLLVPAVAGYLLAVTIKRRPLLSFAGVYIAGAIVVFAAGLTSPITERQAAFLKLRGTSYHMSPLQNTVASYAEALPSAVGNTFFRPLLWEAASPLQMLSAIAVLAFWLVVALAVVRHTADWKRRLVNPIILMLLLFSVSLYIFIGYIVPFPGAIVRYKAIPELVLVTVSLSLIKIRCNMKFLGGK